MCTQLDASFHYARRDRLFLAPKRRRFLTQSHIFTTPSCSSLNKAVKEIFLRESAESEQCPSNRRFLS